MNYKESGYIKLDPYDEKTWPQNEQKIAYIFNCFSDDPIDWSGPFMGTFYLDQEEHENSDGILEQFVVGTFCSRGGFCDQHDVPYWKPVDGKKGL